MAQSQFDKSLRVLSFQILMISSKSPIPADVSGLILKFYDYHNLGKAARIEIDGILGSVGFSKSSKDGVDSYTFKILISHRLFDDTSSRILNSVCGLISRILCRAEFQQKLELAKKSISQTDNNFSDEIRFLDQEIARRKEAHNNLLENCLTKFRKQILNSENSKETKMIR